MTGREIINLNLPKAERREALEEEVRKWGRLTRQKLVERILSLNMHERAAVTMDKPLAKSVRSIFRKQSGDIEGVSFRFPRHGIFLERGVGKHRPVNSAAANKAAKPWISTTLPSATEQLADILAKEYADLVAEDVQINIPGVISTKTK